MVNNMPKMLFVNPSAKSNTNLPNLSLAYAATHFNAKVIDLNTKPEPRNRFLEIQTDVLGISTQSRTLSEAKKIEKEYNKKYPVSKVVSVNTKIDIQCCYPFLKLKENITFEKEFSDEYPFPNYELFDSFDIFLKNWQSETWNYPLMTSLGCPFQCIYCAARNRKWFPRNAKNCFEELKQAKEKWGIKTFEIIDDCFTLDKDRVMEFCKLVKPLNLKWHCVNGLRADRFDEDIAKVMSDSGCRFVGFGIESIDPEVLAAIKKGETADTINNSIDIAKKYFRSVSGFFIIGLPKSTFEKDLNSFRWALKKGINAHFSFYIPFGTSDSLFYGTGSKAVSKEYSKELQMRIYKMTEYMRSVNRGNIVGKFLTSTFSILVYDSKDFHTYLTSNMKRIRRRFL
jgi:radical SAM superfamily enzyme YgiQ (UPF0313 family)